MEHLQLGTVSCSRIVQGFWRLVGWKWSTDELLKFMEQCIALGVDTFDTAEIYDNTECETQIGKALAQNPSLRSKIKLISKMGIYGEQVNGERFGYYNTTYDQVMNSCKAALKRLNTDYIDIYLVHREDPCIDFWETGLALQELKKQGMIKEFGVSNFDPFKFSGLQKATGNALVTNQIEVNPLCFEHFDSGMIDVLTADKIHPLIWSPMAGGRLFTSDDAKIKQTMEKIQMIADNHKTCVETIIYAWLLYHPAKMLPISGSNKISRLESAVKALDVKLEHWEWYWIYTASGDKILR